MVLRKVIDQLFQQLNSLEFRNGIQAAFFEVNQVVLYNIVTKRVEGADRYLVGGGSDELLKAFSHGHHARVGVGKTKNMLGLGIGR